MRDREQLQLTECESKQLVEATRLWFARNGGPVKLKIKSTRISHDHSEIVKIKPDTFEPKFTDGIKFTRG